jgi:predicted nucleotidyltransferase
MTVLQDLAEDLRVHERTLRRGIVEGLVRARRPSPRAIALAPGEAAYLRRHWPVLASLRSALRTERNVRLAVLIGSVARGSAADESDVDLVVRLAHDGSKATDGLRARLSRAVGRSVDVLAFEAVQRDPLLLEAALRDGRVLVDRDGDWSSLLAEEPEVQAAASSARDALRDELHRLLADLTA